MVGKGQNQTIVRDNNMKLILFSLLEKSMSCSDLSDKLMLSKPALTKITSEMLELELIVSNEQQNRQPNSLGRKKSYLSINEKVGIVGAIDFSTVNIRIGLFSLSGKVIAMRELPDSEFITEAILLKVAETLRDMLQSDSLRERELLCLCIGASGKVEKRTGDIVVSPKFYNCLDINVKNYFERQFDVSVFVKNDMDVSLFAEKRFGALQSVNINDAILLYIDSGLGGAIFSDGKILSGSHGFAGEFGLAITVDDEGKEKPYDVIVSINAIKDKIKEYQLQNGQNIFEGNFRFKDVVEKFKEGNETVRQIVFRSADFVARLGASLVDILDTNYIILCGRVRNLGEEYLQRIAQNKLFETRQVKIMFSEVDNAVLWGAAYYAIEAAFDILISRRKNTISH